PDREGAADKQVVGLAAADGGKRWVFKELSHLVKIMPAGEGLVAVDGDTGLTHKSMTWVLDPATGAQVFARSVLGIDCRYDQASVTVCVVVDKWMGAFDQTSKGWLWEIDGTKDEREIPMITAIWHGAVYAKTKDNGPVVIDAKTGADRETNPGLAPFAVNEYLGIAMVDDPATGAGDPVGMAYPVAG
ncbi:MAG: hypothetical protein HKP61_19495, partial [Dactylosporangium sp.]|nr:PQQ-like beta-propeller repeat protein [Dactylosporangium sp.]NNJ63075.1 hypothetical protein [Dactylosporangium sp.]